MRRCRQQGCRTPRRRLLWSRLRRRRDEGIPLREARGRSRKPPRREARWPDQGRLRLGLPRWLYVLRFQGRN